MLFVSVDYTGPMKVLIFFSPWSHCYSLAFQPLHPSFGSYYFAKCPWHKEPCRDFVWTRKYQPRHAVLVGWRNRSLGSESGTSGNVRKLNTNHYYLSFTQKWSQIQIRVKLPCGHFFRKDVRLPVQLQRAMAAEAEAAREARAKVCSANNLFKVAERKKET